MITALQTQQTAPTSMPHLSDELIPAVHALRQSFAPILQRWQRFAADIDQELRQLTENNIPLWSRLARAYPPLLPHVNTLAIGLHQPTCDIGFKLLSLAQHLSCLELAQRPKGLALRREISSTAFHSSLMALYQQLSLDPKRLPPLRLQAALQRHHFGDYSGASRLVSYIMNDLLAYLIEQVNALSVQNKKLRTFLGCANRVAVALQQPTSRKP